MPGRCRPEVGLTALLVIGIFFGAVTAAAKKPWAEKFYNPKPATDDFVLPMPCEGAMVFRPVAVPTGGSMVDYRIVLGGVDTERGYIEGRREGFVGGGFADPKHPGQRLYWLGKYEPRDYRRRPLLEPFDLDEILLLMGQAPECNMGAPLSIRRVSP